MADARIDGLKRSPLFCELSRRDLARVAAMMKERSFAAGAIAAKEGEVGVGFFLIDAGRASVWRGGHKLGELGPGDHFGEIALIAETPRTATVTAETDLHCSAMTSWDFRRLVESHAGITWKILHSIAVRLLKVEELDYQSADG